jgi:glycosyltransferase 2 family protein
MVNFFIRLAIGALAIGALVHFDLIDFRILLRAAANPGYLTVAFLCLLMTAPLAALRWWYLLRAVGFRPTLLWVVNIIFISLFFNTFLPGAHGGDLIRIGMAYRAAGARLNRITFSVIVDRLAGVVALLALAVALLFWLPIEYREGVSVVALGFVLGLTGGITIALLWGDQIGDLLMHLPKPIGPTLAHVCQEIVAALRQYIKNKNVLAIAFAISVFQYILAIIALMVIGRAMDFNALSMSGYGIASVWALVANALPISPGGLGVGEVAFAKVAILLEAVRSGASYASVFLATRVLTVIIGLGGAIPLVVYRSDVRGSMPSTGPTHREDHHRSADRSGNTAQQHKGSA